LTTTPVFRAGVAVSGMYDLPGTYARMDPSGGAFGVRWSESGQGRMGDTPWNELRRYLDNSPYYRLDKLAAPLLLVHGEQDEVCPVSEARKMLNGMRRLKKPGELLVYPGEGHAVSEWSEASAKDAIERILAFLGHELRGDR
jgi:dipeptidyl aminopeptidase/acylaminoacyl peptidase